jgi:hypothetical protein
MTIDRGLEIVATSVVAGATALVALTEVQAGEVVTVFIPMAVAALVGYFTARITTEQRLSSLEAKLESFANEMRLYYRLKGEDDK